MSVQKPKLDRKSDESRDKNDQYVDFSEITHKGLQRMLREAYMNSRERSQPMHKRGKEDDGRIDEETADADEENSKLVDLHQSRGTPAPIPVTDEDLSETVASKLPMKKKGA